VSRLAAPHVKRVVVAPPSQEEQKIKFWALVKLKQASKNATRHSEERAAMNTHNREMRVVLNDDHLYKWYRNVHAIVGADSAIRTDEGVSTQLSSTPVKAAKAKGSGGAHMGAHGGKGASATTTKAASSADTVSGRMKVRRAGLVL
jgi:hypothetical protein